MRNSISTMPSGPSASAFNWCSTTVRSVVSRSNYMDGALVNHQRHPLPALASVRAAGEMHRQKDVRPRVAELQDGRPGRPAPTTAAGELRPVPAVAVDQKRRLRLRRQPEARHPIRAVAELDAGEREALAGLRGIESERHRYLTDVRIHGHDRTPRVLDVLTRLPFRGRPRRVMVVRPQECAVRIEEVQEHAVILRDRRQVGRDVETYRELNRPAEGNRSPAHAQGRHRHGGRRRPATNVKH